MTEKNDHKDHTPEIPINSPAVRILLPILIALLLFTATFFIARDTGMKKGQHDAREKIEAEKDFTAGPESLLQ